MKFTDELHKNLVIFRLTGRILGGNDLTLFQGRVLEYINLNKSNVVLDLSGIDRINSIGLGMLTAMFNTTQNAGGRLVLANTTGVDSILSLTRLVTVFDSYDSVGEAAQSFH